MFLIALIRNDHSEEINAIIGKDIINYNITDLISYYVAISTENFYIEPESDVAYVFNNQHYNINIITTGESSYDIVYTIKDKVTQLDSVNGNIKLELEFEQEGKNHCSLEIKRDGITLESWEKDIYYIERYDEQFLDELSYHGISTHFGLIYNSDNIDDSIELLDALGVQIVRDSIRMEKVLDENGNFDFSTIDKWYDILSEKQIKLFAVLFGSSKLGNDKIVSNDNELEMFGQYVEQITNKYPDILMFEVWNEPNKNLYTTEEQINWYSKVIDESTKIIKSKRTNAKVVSGSTMIPYQEEIEAVNYLKNISQYGAYKISNAFSYHPYTELESMERLIYMNNLFKQGINEIGGFTRQCVTEFGIGSSDSLNEDIRARRIIKQNIINDNMGVDFSNNYGWRDTSETSRYGLLNRDYTPKITYYAMKNYYENTNGAEYIGTLTEVEGITSENLEAHVYDKDGKPKIIVWSNNSDETITIPYKNFKATDLYGEEIQPNEDGNLIITTSPIYLDDVDYSYFYQAISNTATEKYAEFEEKFAEEISQVPDMESKLTQMKNYIVSVGKTTTKVLESASINAMKMHYELGDLILQAYKSGELQVEDVKVSSMLDMLDDIGDSYEDLVTVSAQNVSNIDMNQTNNIIQETETLINEYNNEIEIIYPVKILDFSKEYYDKATYINSLEEENPIKAGLIISNNLHGELLAGWANTFANIQINKYIDEYIANNPVTVKYSTTDFTNKNVTATLETNAEIQVTNNSNSKEHTFEENGSFTFEYTIKGRQFKITATVDNIDKEKPTITGIKNGRVYTHSVTPIITDKNLQKIELTFNGQVVKGYQSNIQLIDEGYYVITATDKAGNSTRVGFQILINQNKDYQIEGNIIKNITNSTTRAEFEKQLGFITKFTITRNGKEISEDSIIATGDVLTTEAGDSYTLIVTGDVNRDGRVTIHDIIKIRIYLVLKNNLDEIELIAADSNLDGDKIGISDLIRVRILVLMGDLTH